MSAFNEGRFWSFVTYKGPIPAHCPELGPCWVWIGRKDNYGYGRLTLNGKEERAHRVSYYLEKGELPPPGICVLHRCDNPACVRRSHHFEGTRADNNADKAKKKRCRPARGDRHGRTKVPDNELPRVRALIAAGATKASVARLYEVDPTTIYSIITGRNRKGGL
jgi:hypothetical protein